MIRLAAFCLVSLTLLAWWVRADEGMWLFNQPPRELLKQKYNFDIADGLLDRVMKASVRFNNGGSGVIVSPRGLVATNHHIGSDSLQKLSKPGQDFYRDGYYAARPEDELKCPDLELNVLQSIEDVTGRVQEAVKPGMAPAEAAAARKAIIARIESESKKKTGLRSDVVTLYQGGLYHLYRYQRYTDVRLVWAPEKAIASFGGDVDNFEYPRYNLDACFFRVYEHNQPAKTPNFLKWSQVGPQEGDLVLVSGHPGSTNRRETFARLLHRRDFTLPYLLARLRYQEATLLQYSERGSEEARQAAGELYSVANARKAIIGQFHGLLDPAIVNQKRQEEIQFEKRLMKQAIDPGSRDVTALRQAQETIAAAQKKLEAFEKEYMLLETGDAFFSRHFRLARHLVRLADELPRPSEQRLPEYRDTALESLKFQLFSPAPIYPELEKVKLTASLMFLAEQLGAGHAVVKQVLTRSPDQRAAELIDHTRLGEVVVRKQLFEGGAKAIAGSKDPMILLARQVDADARALRKRLETEVEEPERQAYALLAKARFALDGTKVPPDATFTLRLAFGTVKGYRVGGQDLPFHTTFAEMFTRAEKQKYRPPFDLPKSWLERKDRLDLATPFNFVATSDTIGGNSGSPVLNRAGEVVGLNFDRNRHGLVRNYVYTDEQARHISVHCRSVLEALDKVYGATALLRELMGK